jgi:hypothetical protein
MQERAVRQLGELVSPACAAGYSRRSGNFSSKRIHQLRRFDVALTFVHVQRFMGLLVP